MTQGLRKTKILATLGPASGSPEIIEQLIQSGADGFRLNFSHGNPDYFRPFIERIRAISKRLDKHIAIFQDLQGPKIRVGRLKGGLPVSLNQGSKFTLTTRDVEGDERIVSTTYSKLPEDVHAGDKILIDDGAIELRVLKASETDVETEVVVGGLLNEKKGINLPGVHVSAESMTKKDYEDAQFGTEIGVDYMALSFVRSASDVLCLRKVLDQHQGMGIKVIAKIEKPEAVKNLKEILDVSDGVMVARGDLGVEVPAEKVPLLQKMIIERANKAERLVITATQMLESMVNNPLPTRAEASDVANAILDGTDIVMLSQETAIGRYPVKAVKTMARIAQYTESDHDVFKYTERNRPQKLTTFTHAIVQSARSASEVMRADAIVVFTQTGLTAQLASFQKPQCPVYAFTSAADTARSLALVWGVYPILFDAIPSSEAMIKRGEDILLQCKALERGDVVIIISGTNAVRGATNMMKLARIGEAS